MGTSIRFIYLICSHLQHHPRVFTSRSSSGFSLWISTFHVELYLGDFFATHQFLLGLHHHQLQHDLYISTKLRLHHQHYSTACISHHSSHHNLTAASPLAHSRGCVVTGPSHYVGVSALPAASATLARSVCVCGARERGNQVNEGSAVGQPFIS